MSKGAVRKTRRRWWRRLGWAAVGLVVAALLAAGAGLIWRTELLTAAGRHWLPELGLEQAELEVVELSGSGLRLEQLGAADPGWSVWANWLRLDFDLEEAWELERARTLVVSGARVSLERAWLEELATGGGDAAGEAGEALGIEALFGLPVDRIEFLDGELVLRDGEREERMAWSASLSFDELRALATAALQIDWGEVSVTVDASARAEGSGSVEVVGRMPDALGLLERVYPDWRTLAGLEADAAVAVGAVGFRAVAEIGAAGAMDVSGGVSVASLAGNYEDIEAKLEAVEISLRLDREGRLSGSAGAWVSSLVADEDFRVEGQEMGIQFASADMKVWELQSVKPLAWDYDVGTAIGVANALRAEVVLGEDGLERLKGDAGLVGVEVDGYALLPLRATFEGDSDALAYAVTALELQEYAGVAVDGGAGSLEFLDTGETRVIFGGTLRRDAVRAFGEGWSGSPLGLTATVRSFDEELLVELALESAGDEGEAVARLGPELAVFGVARVKASGRTNAEGLLWDGKVTLTGEGLKLEGVGWQAGGVGAALNVDLRQIDPELLGSEEATLAVLAEHLAATVGGSWEWSCNEVAGPEVKGQWLGGSGSFGSGPEGVKVSKQFNAGSLEVAGERLQQVSASVDSSGGLERLKSEGTLQYSYEGLWGEVGFKQEAVGLLEDELSLTGEYVVAPLVFDYSDLLSRKVAGLEGMSFSGSVGASGAYWVKGDVFDASVELAIDDGAVSYPPSQVELAGIGARVGLDSVSRLTTRPGASWLAIGLAKVGDLDAREGMVRFELGEGLSLELLEARLRALGGKLELEPGTIDLADARYVGRLRFEGLSLDEISKQISFFDGSMEGAVSGYMPLVYEEGRLGAGEGRLTLAEGTKAALRYNAKGMLSEEKPLNYKYSLAERVLRKLKLEPEPLVEESLSDLRIDALEVALLPRGRPLTPIRISISGSANAGGVSVPLQLEVNVNGTLEELYNFLTRINSLGTVGF